MKISGVRVAKSFRLPAYHRTVTPYVRVDAVRRVWLDAEPARNRPCVYLGMLPAHVRMTDRAAVLDLAEKVMAAVRADGAESNPRLAHLRSAAEAAMRAARKRHH